MSNLQKENKFLKISKKAGHKNAVINKLGNQSIQIKLPCGCTQTQHFFCGKPKVIKEDSLKFKELRSIRSQFFEFCKIH